MNDADLLKIKALNGSQHYAFEELCCQLVSLEPRPAGATFIRKGSGADAGIECFVRQADGSEIGWQAKFFDKFGSGQAAQLTESFDQAIKKHPDLTRYIVCLPINLKDARLGKEKTELERWTDWQKARIADAKALARTVEFELWQATNIRERLHRNDPQYAGRMGYFFSEKHFTSEWFRRHFGLTCDALGARYTPEFNVSLPIRQAFLGISRDLLLEEQREDWFGRVAKEYKGLVSKLKEANVPASVYEPVKDYVSQLNQGWLKTYAPHDPYPLTDWLSQIHELREHCRRCLDYLTTEKDGDHHEQVDSTRIAKRALYSLESCLDSIHEEISGDTWRLSNDHAVLIYGEAGVGKSHLLADMAAEALRKGYPALLLVNSQFFLQEPRKQILERLDLLDINFPTFLGALDAAGQAAGVRTLFMIDALNERNGIDLWREYLAPLVSEVKLYPHLALIVSCRTTYLNIIIPSGSSLADTLPRLEHVGFADGGGRLARAYLAQRKIIRPSAPNLLPEFNNPLFLKTCCDSLDRHQITVFPRGIQGLTNIFQFYLSSLTEEIENRMKLDKRQKFVKRALDAFVENLLTEFKTYLPLEKAISCFDTVLPSMGQQERSLLNELEHEGVLTVEPIFTTDDQLEEQVRFTFERFSDFRIADHLLQQHLESGCPVQPLNSGSPLSNFFSRDRLYSFIGIIEALAVLLPENTGIELPDLLMPERANFNWFLEEAFLKGLLLRRQDSFSPRTRELSINFSSYKNHWLTTLISISSEPDNPFNAHYLDDHIAPLTMPERDASWSVPVAELEFQEGSALDAMISWALESGFDEIEPERAELAAILLSWLFSTSHRTIRDRATKALTALLARRLPLACKLLQRFRQVDDLYVQERLLASIYGATLQAKTSEGLAELSIVVYDLVFADGRPPAHLLLRDYARGILEYSCHRGTMPITISMDHVRPPYQSEWPIEYVNRDDLGVYIKTLNGHTFKDDIVSSASSEWTGDFAKYIIQPAVSYWNPNLLGSGPAKTQLQNFEQLTKMIASADLEPQINALEELYFFCEKCHASEAKKDDMDVPDSPINISIRVVNPDADYWQVRKDNDKIFHELEANFLAHSEGPVRYAYQVFGRHFLKSLMTTGYVDARPDSFDASLAQHWVCKRAHDFGWSNEFFGEFDNRIGTGRGRRDKHIERIGKKYQWLAFYELLARMADNLIFRPGYIDADNKYEGPWQISERNIDPSLLIKKTQDDGWKKHPAVWWSPQALKLRPLNLTDQKEWLENDHDQLNDATFLEVVEPESQRRWLVLKGFKHYGTSYDSGGHIDSWCRIWCVLVRKEHRKRFVDSIAKRTLIDPHALPGNGSLGEVFVGEYPWHPGWVVEGEWSTVRETYDSSRGPKVLSVVSEFEKGTGGYDRSLESNLTFYLPAPWLIRKLNIRLVDGRELQYADQAGRIVFKDPSIHEPGPSAALIDKEVFLRLLHSEKLAPVWIIAGEKGAYGKGADDFIGRRVHSFVYELDATNSIVCTRQCIRDERRSKAQDD